MTATIIPFPLAARSGRLPYVDRAVGVPPVPVVAGGTPSLDDVSTGQLALRVILAPSGTPCREADEAALALIVRCGGNPACAARVLGETRRLFEAGLL